VNDILAGHVSLDVACLDRIYLNGYLPTVQVPGQVVQFLQHRGFPIPSPAVVEKMGTGFRDAVKTFAPARPGPRTPDMAAATLAVRQELETPQDGHVGGRPRDGVDRLRRVTAKLAEQTQATTATHGDDRPALNDLRSAPQAAARDRGDDDGAAPAERRWRGGRRFAGRGRDRQPQDRDDVDRRQPRRPARPQPER
jgi:hypothetical protein